MAAFYGNAFSSTVFFVDGSPPPPTPVDTHDGAGWMRPSKHYRKPNQELDKQEIGEAIKRAAGLIIEEEPENETAVSAVEASIQDEIRQPEVNLYQLATSIERLMQFAAATEQIYADLYALSQKLYDELDEEEAVILLLM